MVNVTAKTRPRSGLGLNELLGEWHRQQFLVFAKCPTHVEPIVVFEDVRGEQGLRLAALFAYAPRAAAPSHEVTARMMLVKTGA